MVFQPGRLALVLLTLVIDVAADLGVKPYFCWRWASVN